MRKLIEQNPQINECGECCIATLLCKSLEEVKEAVGAENGTNRSDLDGGLRKFGYMLSRKLRNNHMTREFFETINADLLIAVEGSGDVDHWIMWDAQIMGFRDPMPGINDPKKRAPNKKKIDGFFLLSKLPERPA